MSGDWRLHQKLFQILAKDADCTLFGFFCQLIADIALDRRGDQTVIAVLNHGAQYRLRHRIFFGNYFFCKVLQNTVTGCFHLNGQEFLYLAAVQCQHTVSRCLFERLLVLIVHLINTLRLFIPRGAGELALVHRDFPDVHSVIRFIGNSFRKDILCALQRFLCIRCAFFRIHISSCRFFQRTGKFLFPDQIGKSVQPLFLCNTRSRLSLRTVRAV